MKTQIDSAVYDRDDVQRSITNADTRAERDGEPYMVCISEDGLRLFTMTDGDSSPHSARPAGTVLIYSTADGKLL